METSPPRRRLGRARPGRLADRASDRPAWAYVVLRIAHSLIQVSVNIVLYRALLFALSSLCLIGLAAFAFWMVMF